MFFCSPIFIFLFLPMVLSIYHLLKTQSLKNHFLLMSSLAFYFWSETFHISLLLALIILNYSAGILLHQTKNSSSKKVMFFFAISINLIILALFKNSFWQSWLMPLGLSFITFHSLSYLTDIYRGKIKAEYHLSHFALYITLFPHLIAGPIIRYPDIVSQLSERKMNRDDWVFGIQRFIIGLVKKCLIADTLSSLVDPIFKIPHTQLSMGLAWFGIVTYSLQLYFDFSGYSDMAIGLCRLFGFKINENFNYPYSAHSIRDFWQRWHMTLSQWFRDYVYIPLGGNRVSLLKNYINLITVFILCGLWHGSRANFIIWGLYHGLFLILERTAFGKWLQSMPAVFQHTYTFFIITLGWVFFKSTSLSEAFTFLTILFNFNHLSFYFNLNMNSLETMVFLTAVLMSTPITLLIQSSNHSLYLFSKLSLLLLLFCICLMKVAADTYHPFIYFRF